MSRTTSWLAFVCIMSLFLPLFVLVTLSTTQTLNAEASYSYTDIVQSEFITNLEEKIQLYPEDYDSKLIQYIKEECQNSQVPFSLVCALIKKESKWNITCHSANVYKGEIVSIDYNLMQLNSKYIDGFVLQFKDKFRSVSSYDAKHNPYDNVQIGIRHLRFLYDQLKSWKRAVTAYNAGMGAVLRKQVPKSTLQYVKEVCPVDTWWVLYRP